MTPRSQRPRKPMNPVPIEERSAKTKSLLEATAGPILRDVNRSLSRKALMTAGGGAALGGAYYLGRRHGRIKAKNQKEKTVTSKNLINPFEEVVVFGKAYPVALPVPGAKQIGALVHTGKHVGHGQKLTHVRNGKGGGGRATRLERYTGGHAKQSMGPFGKAAGFGGAASRQFAAKVRPTGPSVKNGLRMISDMPKAKGVPGIGRINSNVPTGPKRGVSLRRADIPANYAHAR